MDLEVRKSKHRNYVADFIAYTDGVPDPSLIHKIIGQNIRSDGYMGYEGDYVISDTYIDSVTGNLCVTIMEQEDYKAKMTGWDPEEN